MARIWYVQCLIASIRTTARQAIILKTCMYFCCGGTAKHAAVCLGDLSSAVVLAGRSGFPVAYVRLKTHVATIWSYPTSLLCLPRAHQAVQHSTVSQHGTAVPGESEAWCPSFVRENAYVISAHIFCGGLSTLFKKDWLQNMFSRTCQLGNTAVLGTSPHG